MQKYSRLASTEERRNFRSAVILIILTIAVIAALFVYGIPVVGRVASFVSGLKGSTSPITSGDKTPPAPPKFNNFADFTNQQYITLSGTAEPGATVKLSFNSGVKDTIVDKDGNFTFPNLSLKDGENTFSAIAQDNTGNTSQKISDFTISYDTKPPDLTIDSPADGTKFFGSTQRQINIQGTSETGANVTINDRIVSVDDNGRFQYPITLNSGDNALIIKATDAAGNSTEKTITLNFSE